MQVNSSKSKDFDEGDCAPFCASSAACSGRLDTHYARSIFAEVHALGKNVFYLFFAVCGEKLCEAGEARGRKTLRGWVKAKDGQYCRNVLKLLNVHKNGLEISLRRERARTEFAVLSQFCPVPFWDKSLYNSISSSHIHSDKKLKF